MADHDIGGIVGHLRLDKSNWSAEIKDATAQATKLSRVDPKVSISVEGTARALTQLESVAAAAKRLQDAQGKVSLAQLKYNDLVAKGDAPTGKLKSAQEGLARATREVELSQIRLASAYEKVDADAQKAMHSSDGLGRSLQSGSRDSSHSLLSILIPAIGAVGVAAIPLAAVFGGVFATVGLGIDEVKTDFKQLTPEVKNLQAVAAKALGPGLSAGVTTLQSVLPQLSPLISAFGQSIGAEFSKFSVWLSDGNLKGFVDYSIRELPVVTHLFETLGSSAAKALKGLAQPADDLLRSLDSAVSTLQKLSDAAGKIKLPGASNSGGGLSGIIGGLESYLTGDPRGLLHAGQIAGGYIADGVKSALGGIESLFGGGGPSAADKQKKLDAQVAQNAKTATARDGVFDPTGAVAASVHADTVRVKELQTALLNVRDAGNTAIQGLTTAMDAFGQSTGTAGDKAKLLGAVLKTSQGDALSYSAAVAGGFKATQDLVDTFQQQAKDSVGTPNTGGSAAVAGHIDSTKVALGRDKVTAATARLNAAEDRLNTLRAKSKTTGLASAEASVASARSALASANASLGKSSSTLVGGKKGSAGSGGSDAAIAFQDTEKAAINLKTGLINLKAVGAVPLIQQLQAMQDGAIGAAQAVYQHEVSTQGDTQALKDAQTIFESMTHDSLIKNAKQLGLTADQAKKLADNYLGVPKDLSTQVQAIGLSDVNDTLERIGELLAKATGQPWDIQVNFHSNIPALISQLPRVLQASGQLGLKGLQVLAGGGLVTGEGTGTSDSILARLSNREFVMPADVVAKPGVLPMLEAMRSGGSGVQGPGIGSPAARSVSATYTTPPPQSGPTVVHLTSYTQIDGRTITTTVDEYHLKDNR